MDPAYTPSKKLVKLCKDLDDNSPVVKMLANGKRLTYDAVKVLASLSNEPYSSLVKDWFEKIHKPQLKFRSSFKILKFDEELGLVLGYGIICKENGEDYFDLQNDHIPEESMLKAAFDFMENSASADEMHDFEKMGTIIFAWPLTTEIAKVFDIDTPRTGLLIAMKPSADVLEKFKSGEYTGFSIGGERIVDEPVEE